MASDLPLKIRVDIRDLWNNSQTPLQKAVTGLSATLGRKVVPQVQWPILWEELKKDFPDPTDFIPGVVAYTIAWYEVLTSRLENDAFEEWTEKLLTALSEKSTGAEIALRIEAQPAPKVPTLRTVWDGTFGSFYLYIPRGPVHWSTLSSALEQEFDSFFGAVALDGRSAKVPIDDDEWADLEDPTTPATSSSPSYGRGGSGRVPKPTEAVAPKAVPTVTALARPNELFQTVSPYILIVETGNPMLVQCSHQKSLELLSQYLNKWGKANTNDSMRRNVFSVNLIESDFAVGVNDLLRIEPNITYGRTGSINPTIVLAFVEGVLGYKYVSVSGNRFVYRLDDILR